MKELSGPVLPGYKVYEYQLILVPHEALCEKIALVRSEFSNAYKKDSGKSRPQLMLARFVQYKLKEERIVNHLKTIAKGFSPFKVDLKDFGSSPTHSIFVNVTSKLPIQQLVKAVRTNTQHLMKLNNEHKPQFILEPQMNVATRLLPWQYEKGWLEYREKHFTARFIADGMLLLKRAVGSTHYETLLHFDFQSMPVAITQGELF